MPRIAAAIGVFATIAVFTFINIKSYPTVWEMVGTSPWFTQQAGSSSPVASPQTEEIVTETRDEVDATLPQLQSLTGTDDLSLNDSTSPASATPLGFTPRIISQSEFTTGRDADNSCPAKMIAPREQHPSTGSAAYQGLNMGPIMISGTGQTPTKKLTEEITNDSSAKLTALDSMQCPAKMSPQIKYAAKPTLLESSKRWNAERPLVPVILPPKKRTKPDLQAKSRGNKTRDESVKKAKPNTVDSSCTRRPEAQGAESAKAIVRHLPPVDTNNQPILMSISADGPIPIYPHTD